MRTSLVLAIAAALATPACLGSSHRIPKRELMQLAMMPPEQRSERVRVVQGFAGDDEPPAAPRVTTTTVVVVHASGGGGSGPVGRRPRPSSANLGELKAKKSEDYMILAALAALGLAATEGARYDGWVQLHPMHPVHLYGAYGEYTWVPLAQLDPDTAAWATRAFVRPQEGPWTPLGRAPLNRQGFTYSVLVGAGEIPSSVGTNDPGFLGHIQFGYFPTPQLGVLLDLAMGNRLDETADTVFDFRSSLELEYFPVIAGRLHLGGFGQLGLAARTDDGPGVDSRGPLVGGGGLLQIDITTRLAMTLRAGITKVHGVNAAEFGLGLSVY
jgi:hypothetical protein